MEKITESTLENFKATEGRATGNTTQLMDLTYPIEVLKAEVKKLNCESKKYKKENIEQQYHLTKQIQVFNAIELLQIEYLKEIES